MPEDWAIFEDHCLEMLDLEGTVSSGSQWHDKGDGKARDVYAGNPFPLLIDAKTTVKNSFSVSAKFMREYVEKAIDGGRRFALPLRFVRPNGRHEDYVVLGLDDFAELLMLAKRGAGRE